MKFFQVILVLISSFALVTPVVAGDFSNSDGIIVMDRSELNSDKLLPNTNRNNNIKGKINGEITASATADPLWYVEIDYIYSSNVGWESINASDFSTSSNHGGAQLRARVLELGYGGSRLAWMAGSLLPSSSNYFNDDICWDFSGNLTFSCSAGMTLAGYARYYNLDGNQSGTFQFQSTSIVSPWNTEYDSLYIQ